MSFSENCPGVIINRQVCPFHPATSNTWNIHVPKPINLVATHLVRPPVKEYNSSSNDTLFNQAQVHELFVYYPEQPYIAVTLPTGQPRELIQFFKHCQGLITMQPFVHFAHPIEAFQHITANPLNFINLLFQTHITISHARILWKIHLHTMSSTFWTPWQSCLGTCLHCQLQLGNKWLDSYCKYWISSNWMSKRVESTQEELDNLPFDTTNFELKKQYNKLWLENHTDQELSPADWDQFYPGTSHTVIHHCLSQSDWILPTMIFTHVLQKL